MVHAMKFVTDAGGIAHVENHILALSREVKNIIISRAPNSIVSPHDEGAMQSGLTAFYPFRWNEPHLIFRDRKSVEWVVQELLKKNN